jgi:hypothetical protein
MRTTGPFTGSVLGGLVRSRFPRHPGHQRYTFVPEFSYTVTEYDPDQPWVVIGRGQHTVTLDADENFFLWARERWPEPRWSVELDPYQL